MSKNKVTVSIQGYGQVKVKIPKALRKKRERVPYIEGVAQAVAQTMQLTDPQTQAAQFHPALGFDGFRS